MNRVLFAHRLIFGRSSPNVENPVVACFLYETFTLRRTTKIQYSIICLIGHLKRMRKKWRIMQTGENSYHRSSYTLS